ncbi:MAG: DEAD/DEAH box helicase [Bacteroidales bacterium]
MKDFEKKFNGLSHLHKGILQFLCYLNEPIARTNIYNGLRNNRIFKKYGIKLTAKTVGLALQKLIAEDFVVADKKYFQAKEDVIVPVCRNLAENKDEFEAISKTVKENKYISTPESQNTLIKIGIREFRNTILQNDIEGFLHQYKNLTSASSKSILNSSQIKNALFKPFQRELLSKLPPEKQFEIFFYFLSTSMPNMEKMDLEFTEGFGITLAKHPIYREWANIYLIFKGALKDIFEDDQNQHFYNDIACQATCLLFNSKEEESIQLFEYCIKLFLSKINKEEGFLPDFPGIFHILALFKRNKENDLITARKLIYFARQKSEGIIGIIYSCLDILLRSQDDVNEEDIETLEELIRPSNYNLGEFFAYFCLFQLDKRTLRNYLISLENLHKRALENNFQWIALETAVILRKMGVKAHEKEITIAKLEDQYQIRSILPFNLKTQKWQKTLVDIQKINIDDIETISQKSRLAWEVDFDALTLSPLEQKKNLQDEWSKGRKISLQRLKEENLSFLSAQDKKIISHLYLFSTEGSSNYRFDIQKAFPLLANHPYLFSDEKNIELISEELKLDLEKTGNYYKLSFPKEYNTNPPIIIPVNNNSYKIIEANNFHQKLFYAMGGQPLVIPEEQFDKLKKILKRVKNYVSIRNEFIQDIIPTIVPNNKTVVQFRKSSLGGLKLELFVQPIEGVDLFFKPGRGPEIISGVLENLRVKTHRNLKEEVDRARELTKISNGLKSLSNLQNQIHLTKEANILELLLELNDLQYRAQIKWKDKDYYRLSGSAGTHDLSINISNENNWFRLKGSLKVNDEDHLSLKEILKAVTADNKRFIKISEGLYVAVTDELKRTLQKISIFTQEINNLLYIHPLAALAFENIKEEVRQFQADEIWDKKIDELKNLNTYFPSTPNGLKAELRPYQQEGFKWLARLSKANIGACLADDMGLGKTIQTLALLLKKANEGPSIVIAPASVCFNWINEFKKFTTEITPRTLPLNKAERANFIYKLSANDVLVCSYGLLQTEAELLKDKQWSVAILDEAHAIKNYASKRAKAAWKLNANYKIVTTGTPIQNNLDELWSLFEFINPGLLGPYSIFQRKFGIVDDHEENQNRRDSLRRILKPYILRRTKDEVLKDLPKKTEITLEINLSDEEKALYQNLNQHAIENIQKTNALADRNAIQILAELTKLRMASCHPKLVNSKSEIQSSKLKALDNLLENIVSTGHKVLVFSQFTTHLNLIRRHLEKQNYSIHYMDGKTPVSKREHLVNIFQKGVGDIFLISLKTGGVGLNLTAADYVIHMDPWWNPATEDQASDRAHRIGQENPVTIYRLIASDTIEEKIIDLHSKKRDLAQQLLKGTNKISQLSIESMYELITSK